MRLIDADTIKYTEYINGDVTVSKAIIDNQPTVNEWIPFISEYDEEKEYFMLKGQLPEEDQEILICTKHGGVHEDIFMKEGFECYLDSGYGISDDVIAWQPKPQPYIPKDGIEHE